MSSQLATLNNNATAGDVEAQLQLADLYENGVGVAVRTDLGAFDEMGPKGGGATFDQGAFAAWPDVSTWYRRGPR